MKPIIAFIAYPTTAFRNLVLARTFPSHFSVLTFHHSALVAACLLSIPLIALAQKEAPPGPSGLKVEFESQSVMVLRIRLAPHEKTPMHQVTPRVVIWLTDAHLRDTFADGRISELQRKAGTTEWVPAQEHSGQNLGNQLIEFIAIVPKTAAKR
jgi:beta-alanine degradation protein BauB